MRNSVIARQDPGVSHDDPFSTACRGVDIHVVSIALALRADTSKSGPAG
jgi:hypothetical protein